MELYIRNIKIDKGDEEMYLDIATDEHIARGVPASLIVFVSVLAIVAIILIVKAYKNHKGIK